MKQRNAIQPGKLFAFFLALTLSQFMQGAEFHREVGEKYPALRGLKILFVRHREDPKNWWNPAKRMKALGVPSHHESQSSMPKDGYDCEIALLDLESGIAKTVFRPEGNFFAGHLELHWDADRLLFTQSDPQNWKIWEMNIDGSGLRQLSRTPPDVDSFEPVYVPGGRIVFASNAPFQCVPCWNGVEDKFVANLYSMNADGSGMRRLCFDQTHDSNPALMRDGRILYARWDYAGINRVFYRPLMTMNPDGTNQRVLYGSNSWFPNALVSNRELPGSPGRFLSILAGYHGSCESGQFVVIDTNRDAYEEKGIVQRISGRGLPVDVRYEDRLTESDPQQFLTPFPVTDDVFLVSGWMEPGEDRIGIYVADASDNLSLLYAEEGIACIEPIPILKRPAPRHHPDQVDLTSKEATIYIRDVYAGPGLAGVPRGTVAGIRVIAYDFGYVGLAGNDIIGLSGPWDAMRILGTTPIEPDGSASFRIPANTSVAFQPIDREGKAVQLMRSWFTAMPGESVSCVGCHESPTDVPAANPTLASRMAPRELRPFYGPARGFDFAREVQPVLNRHCVSCHDGGETKPDLRPENEIAGYVGHVPGHWDRARMHDVHRKIYGDRIPYTPAYEALIEYVRRVNFADDVSLLRPGHYHADTSELIQILQDGHHGVELDHEAWDRLVTWIDLNAPCHGTWEDVYGMETPSGHHRRRRELNKLYASLGGEAEDLARVSRYDEAPVARPSLAEPPGDLPAFQLGPRDQWNSEFGALDLGGGIAMRFVRIPAEKPFWMGVCEVSNEQFQAFDPDYFSGYYTKRHTERADSKGTPLYRPRQPVLRVSWNEAMEFCEWLSKKSGKRVTLPTEGQWQLACRAGSPNAFHFGTADDDFSRFANLADRTFATAGIQVDGNFRVGGDGDLVAAEGVSLAERRFDDGGLVTMPVGSYLPNSLGLHDMHGNAAEWTATDIDGERIVKGGSYLDRPERCAADLNFRYPPWQRVYNAGFRVVCDSDDLPGEVSEKVSARPAGARLARLERLDLDWETIAGFWRNEHGNIMASESGGIVFAGNPDWRDIAVEAQVIKSKAVPCVLARCRDADNFYNLELGDRSLDLWKRVGGQWTKMGTAPIESPAKSWHSLRLEAEGPVLRGFLDQAKKIEVKDESLAAGRIGLRASAGKLFARFKQVRVASPGE